MHGNEVNLVREGLTLLSAGGTRAGGNLSFGPAEVEGADAEDARRVTSGFRPASKFVTGLVAEMLELLRLEVEPLRLPAPLPIIAPEEVTATVQNMTCACFWRSRRRAYCFRKAAISSWSRSFSEPEDEEDDCLLLLNVMSVIRRPCRTSADGVNPPKTVA